MTHPPTAVGSMGGTRGTQTHPQPREGASGPPIPVIRGKDDGKTLKLGNAIWRYECNSTKDKRMAVN